MKQGDNLAEAIKLEGVTKILGNRQILKDINLAVKIGDIFGYLGSKATYCAQQQRMRLANGCAPMFSQF